MQKSTIIATCLLNAATVVDMETGEALVMTTFQQHFPDESFESWNGDVDPAKAAHCGLAVMEGPSGAFLQSCSRAPSHRGMSAVRFAVRGCYGRR